MSGGVALEVGSIGYVYLLSRIFRNGWQRFENTAVEKERKRLNGIAANANVGALVDDVQEILGIEEPEAVQPPPGIAEKANQLYQLGAWAVGHQTTEMRQTEQSYRLFVEMLKPFKEMSGFDMEQMSVYLGYVIGVNPDWGLRKLHGLIRGQSVFSMIPTIDGVLGYILKHVFKQVSKAATKVGLRGVGSSRYRKAAVGILGCVTLYCSYPFVAENVGKAWLTDAVIWLGRGFFATQSKVHFGHLQLLTTGLKMSSSVVGDGALSKILQVIPDTVSVGGRGVRAGVWALGTGVHTVLFGKRQSPGTFARLMGALEPSDAIRGLGLGRRVEGAVLRALGNHVGPMQILRAVFSHGYTVASVGSLLLQLGTGPAWTAFSLLRRFL
eukprot:1158577-Rhodomonas_salina.2